MNFTSSISKSSRLCRRWRCISLMSFSSSSEVILEKVDNVGVITLNRPKALNALNTSMIQSIYPTLKQWENEVSHVIIKGTGDKAFCAGGDVRAITEGGMETAPAARKFFASEYQLNHLIGTLKIPYIALIHGITMGGGVGLSVHGKYRVASDNSVFAMPETAIGMFTDVGGSYFLPRLSGNIGIYLGLTGFRLTGIDLLHAGIATHYCKNSERENLEAKLKSAKDPSKLKEILDDCTKKCTAGMAAFSLKPHVDKINKYFSSNVVEEIQSKLRNENSPWSRDLVEKLSKMSPTAVKVTLHVLREGKKKSSLKECLQMEYRVACRTLENKDFYEGVRAVLIDKDNRPKWIPNRLEDVSEDKVKSFFAPLPSNEELQID